MQDSYKYLTPFEEANAANLMIFSMTQLKHIYHVSQNRFYDAFGTQCVHASLNTIFVKMRQNAHFETTTTDKNSKIVVEAKEETCSMPRTYTNTTYPSNLKHCEYWTLF